MWIQQKRVWIKFKLKPIWISGINEINRIKVIKVINRNKVINGTNRIKWIKVITGINGFYNNIIAIKKLIYKNKYWWFQHSKACGTIRHC